MGQACDINSHTLFIYFYKMHVIIHLQIAIVIERARKQFWLFAKRLGRIDDRNIHS